MEETPRARFGPFSFLSGFALGVFIGVGVALMAVIVTQDPTPAPSAVLEPTVTPDPRVTATATPQAPVRVNNIVDVRLGPGAGFAVIGLLGRGENVEVVGRDNDGQWVAIRFPPGSIARGWIPASAIDNLGDVDSLAVVLPTPLPRTISTPSPGGGASTNGGSLDPVVPGATTAPGRPTITPTPSPPDLVITRLSVLPDGRVAVTVANRGPGDLRSGSIHVQIRNHAGRSELITTPLVTLRAGGTLIVETEIFRVLAEEEVIATVDPFGTLGEIDPNNNTITVVLVPPPPPPTPTPTPPSF